MTETPQGSNRTQPSLGALMSRVSENISTLIRTEIALNKAKAAETGKRFGLGAGLLGAAGVHPVAGNRTLATTMGGLTDCGRAGADCGRGAGSGGQEGN